jgi:hypothetical protein
MFELLILLPGALRATLRSRADLNRREPAPGHQLAVLTRPGRKRPPLRVRDKLVWILARRLCWDWRRHIVFVRPETVVRWQRQAWKLFWRSKSRTPLGRPRLSAEVQQLIATMARANPGWGTERIRGELLKLRITVSNRWIRRYHRRGPVRPPSQTGRTFLANLGAWAWRRHGRRRVRLRVWSGPAWASAVCTMPMNGSPNGGRVFAVRHRIQALGAALAYNIKKLARRHGQRPQATARALRSDPAQHRPCPRPGHDHPRDFSAN